MAFGCVILCWTDILSLAVYVGNASAIAFLQYLRGKVRVLGPDFTISQGCHRMFEAQVPLQQTDDFADDIDDAERRTLVQRFLDASSGLLDLFDESGIDRLLAVADPPSIEFDRVKIQNGDEGRLCLYMMVAIGAQCRGQPGDAHKAFRYFEEARKLSFAGMLSDPTLDTARGFVLMAFYMFGACRRNSAFMYLGVATKAASVMGLHMADQFQSLSKDERSLRSRVDKSIRLFDVVCSSILGRPTSIAPCRLKENTGTQNGRHRTQSVEAACTLATTLNEIVNTLTEESQLGIIKTQRFLDKVKDWSKNLPSELRQHPQRGSNHSLDSQNRQISIGNIHVACTYYFSIMLTTREFLIEHIMSQIENEPPFADCVQDDTTSETKQQLVELSDACVDAAVFMSDMCSEALDCRIIMGNMCILKAWLFSAGLVLGFSLLAPGVSQTRGRAFHNALRVLDFLGHLSPQAAQYHRLLLSFSQAIDTFKSHSPVDHRQPRPPYVERLLSLSLAESTETTHWDATASQLGHVSYVGSADNFDSQERTGEKILDSQLTVDTTECGGEDVILSLLWDGETTTFPRGFGFAGFPQ
ncbi:C6 transcription factor [Colletotrichum tofieldiae]|uniref:C6 transcription factor n=1 Tax=Colletotrichum tofieldiae TaxID=708197 RepID=A0A161YPJ7_9PEZI|nr:C6 transcription factor [Colletotrichum tofieldiae]